jgi:hypothetical protein
MPENASDWISSKAETTNRNNMRAFRCIFIVPFLSDRLGTSCPNRPEHDPQNQGLSHRRSHLLGGAQVAAIVDMNVIGLLSLLQTLFGRIGNWQRAGISLPKKQDFSRLSPDHTAWGSSPVSSLPL